MKKSYHLYLVLALVLLNVGCAQMLNNQTIKSHFDEKMNGFSYVAPGSPVGEETMTEIANIGGNWISIIPYAMCKSDKANLVFNAHGQYWGECDSGVFICI